jgi:ATP-dependent Clp endopeptidase proteolytic subunit ClpP
MKSWYKIEAKGEAPPEVLIYGDIGDYDISARQFHTEFSAIKAREIDLRINSRGGSVFEGVAMYNTIKNHPAKVTAHIDSLAASIASFIPMAADRVIIAKNGRMMIHKAWGIEMGNADQFRKTAETLDDVDTILIDAYAERTGMGKDEIKALLAAETWMNPKKAKELGFVDEIAGDEGAKAKYDLSPFQNVPEEVKALFGKEGSTERDLETLLRDAGVSRKDAKTAIAAIKGQSQRDADEEREAAARVLTNIAASTLLTKMKG